MTHFHFRDQVANGFDPTGTAGVRRRFRADGNRRLKQLRRLLFDLVVNRDVLGQRENDDPLLRQLVLTDPRIAHANFERQFTAATTQALTADDWWYKYLQQSWQSGQEEAAKATDTEAPDDAELPDMQEARSRTGLALIAGLVATTIARRVAQGMAADKSPQEIYRGAAGDLDKIASQRLNAWSNTETVSAHNEGRLDQLEAAGVEEVGLVPEAKPLARAGLTIGPQREIEVPERLVPKEPYVPEAEMMARVAARYAIGLARARRPQEFDILTAGDDLVCEECEAAALDGPYSIDEARGMLPLHPNCRCTWVPAGEYSEEELLGEDYPKAERDVEEAAS